MRLKPGGFHLATSIVSNIYIFWKNNVDRPITSTTTFRRLPFRNFKNTIEPSSLPGASLTLQNVGLVYLALLQKVASWEDWPGHLTARLRVRENPGTPFLDIGSISIDNTPRYETLAETGIDNATSSDNERSVAPMDKRRWLTCFAQVLIITVSRRWADKVTDDPKFRPQPWAVRQRQRCPGGADDMEITVYPAANNVLTWDEWILGMTRWLSRVAINPENYRSPYYIGSGGTVLLKFQVVLQGPVAEHISISEFNYHLEKYESTIPTKLSALSKLRYNEIPQNLIEREETGDNFLTKPEIEQLVEWKLKHGTFRPSLARLVASNSDEFILNTTLASFKAYSANELWDPLPAIATLCKLKGIGPATASLLLSCYDPHNVPFFSDELFLWLHESVELKEEKEKKTTKKRKSSPSRPTKISYNIKEYGSIFLRTTDVRSRLSASSDSKEPVSAVDVERVAYSIMKSRQQGESTAGVPDQEETSPPRPKRQRKKRAG
ncbi:MAG: hypothetical protein Q9220_005573 [cf. Caloplaca sp. 1 TL-2023]